MLKKNLYLFFIITCLFSSSLQAKTNHYNIPNKTVEPISYLIYDQYGSILEQKDIYKIWPIASITKLMTALVFSENNLNPSCTTSITINDQDLFKHTKSRLPSNRIMQCQDLMWMMLIISDNTAANALSKSLPGINQEGFIGLMNKKALQLGMVNTHFVDPSGLSSLNVSNAYDLTKLISYLSQRPNIVQSTIYSYLTFRKSENERMTLKNTNKLVRENGYHPILSKTGHISESGFNLVYAQKENCPSAIGLIILGSGSAQARTSFATAKINKFCSSN